MQSGGQRIFLVRHGETEWSQAGRHTGRTDMPLTDAGQRDAAKLGTALAALTEPVSKGVMKAGGVLTDAPSIAGGVSAGGGEAGAPFEVWSSPLQRAKETARLAGFPNARIDDDLREWDYGIYEGRTTLDIRKEHPEWSVWLSPITNGESLDDVANRARRVIDRILATPATDVALFAHGHFLRILAACWIQLPPITGRYLALDTASISVLGYERQTRVIRRWNSQ